MMDTMTTVDAVEKTESGAYKITLLGDVVAGTRDAEIGALAEKLAGETEANPVAVKLEKLPGGKLLIKEMSEITQGDALDAEDSPAVEPEDVAKTEAIAPGSDPTGEANDADDTARVDEDQPADITEGEMHALALEEAAAYIRGLEA